MVNGERYEKQIQPPKVKQILLLSKQEKEELDEAPLYQGEYREKKGSTFYAYSAKVQNMEQVRVLYAKLRKEHLNASHIACGYCFFHANTPLYQDYSDDGEYGGGRKVLNAIQQVGVFNFCVFIVHYHGGLNLGPTRFDIISELSRDAIASYPKGLDYGQLCGCNDKQLLSSHKKSAVKGMEENASGE